MNEFYKVVKANPFLAFNKNDLIIVKDNVINVNSSGHITILAKDNLHPAMLVAMITAGFIKKIGIDTKEYAIGNIIAIRSEHLYCNKSTKKNKWTVSICMIDNIEPRVKYNQEMEVVLTVHDIYSNKDEKMYVVADKVIGKTTKYWYINSHNEVATDYFYRSKYDDKIRLATNNCFIDDESCRAKIRENEHKMNCSIGGDIDYIKRKVEEFETERAKKIEKDHD